MTDQPTTAPTGAGAGPETDAWHRRFAREQFNAAWELIEDPAGDADADVAMLLAAMAADGIGAGWGRRSKCR
jgi:hypothetical protein